MAVNKVIYGDNTLIDISDSTVTPETLAEGVIAYNAAGERIVGTMKQGSQVEVSDDGNGNVVITGVTVSDDDNGNVTVTGLTNIEIGE